VTVQILYSEKREECGIIGIYSKTGKDVAPLLYRALIALQHRGQDAAGFAIYDGKEIQVRRGIGLVDQIFKPEDLDIAGSVGIGHTRYPTIGNCRMCDVQPSTYKKIATAHNGHLANYDELKGNLEANGYTFVSTVDSEPMAYALHKEKNTEKAVKNIMNEFEGSFSDVVLIENRMIVFRDKHAIRPLVWGENEDFICFASETVALDINSIPYKGDVAGGEMIEIENGKITKRKQLVETVPKHCMFEYVYFSRPDSYINGKSVHDARIMLGEILAEESPVKADVVVPVPDTSRSAASGYARKTGMPYDEGLIKNRYIGRTFIMSTQSKRVDAVKLKLNALKPVIEGKSIVLIDDSIVRGTTLKEIVGLLKNAGAKEIHVRITCPPIRAPCFYGVDIPTYKELVANNLDVEGIRKSIGADSLYYISLDGLKNSIGVPLCTGCINGEYHTDYVKRLAEKEREKEA